MASVSRRSHGGNKCSVRSNICSLTLLSGKQTFTICSKETLNKCNNIMANNGGGDFWAETKNVSLTVAREEKLEHHPLGNMNACAGFHGSTSK